MHLGGTLDEVVAAEEAVARGEHAERPFVLLVQATVADPSRAPEGKHTGWAYCHVPNGSTRDMTAAIEAQVERFAPGFGDLILVRSRRWTAPRWSGATPTTWAATSTGACRARPSSSRARSRGRFPTRTPIDGVYLCSSSTPPGGGVHGMGGYWAAQAALGRE